MPRQGEERAPPPELSFASGSRYVPWRTDRWKSRTVKNMARLQNETSVQPEQREKHVAGLQAGRKEAGKDGENAQRDLDLIRETLGSHGRSLSRGVTSHLPLKQPL